MEQSITKHLTQDSVDKFTSKNQIKSGLVHVNNVTNMTRHYVQCAWAVQYSHVPTMCCFCGLDTLHCVGVYSDEDFFFGLFFFFHASCVCECTRGQSVNQPPIETTAHRTRLWLSGLCCQLFSCIVLLAGCLFKLSTVSHSAYMDAQLSPHTRTYSMLCNSNDCSPALHVRVEGRRVVTVCLSTWF